VTIFYFENVVPGGDGYFGPVMTTGAIAFILGVMATSPLAKRFGKKNFYLVSMSLTALLTFGFYFVPPENIELVWAANTIINFCAAPTAPLVWAMYADTADYSEWKWGRRATGLVFSAASFAQKLGWAIGGAGAGWLLAFFGYLPNVAQSPETIHGIVLMMSVIPAVAAVAAVAALWFYEIDEETVKRMSADLEARRGPEPVEGVMPATPLPTALPAAAIAEHPEVVAGRSASDVTEIGPAPVATRRVAPSAPRIPALAAGGSGAVPVPTPLSPQELADLAGEFAETLHVGVHGLCFSPYLEGQSPGSLVDEAQIRARLGIIRPYTRWVRSTVPARLIFTPIRNTCAAASPNGCPVGKSAAGSAKAVPLPTRIYGRHWKPPWPTISYPGIGCAATPEIAITSG